MAELDLPPCGLYRTTLAHPDRPEQVGSGRLVHFHNHSNSGKPIVLLPKENTHNVWTFHDRGYSAPDAAWCHTLQPLLEEGLYVTNDAVQVADDRLLAEGQLVQLGYNGFGDPILFFPTRATSANALLFPEKGLKIAVAHLAALTAVKLAGAKRVN